MTSTIELRRFNRNAVYRNLLGAGVKSKQEIAMRTGLSIPTVSQNLYSLTEDGLVAEIGIMKSTGGRPAAGFSCVADARYAIGIDITKNHITIAVPNLNSELLFQPNREQFRFKDTEGCLEEIATKVRQIIQSHSIEEDKVLGVGISVPCIVDTQTNEITYSKIIDAPSNLAEKMGRMLPFPINVFNDANSAGIAEMNENDLGKTKGTMIYLMLSNSVGGAAISEGNIYLGDNSRSAEIGHVRIVPNGKPCYCGQKGCVNAYCSAEVLANLTDGKLEDFFAKLAGGDKACKKAFDEYLKYLSIAIVNLHMLYDSDIIIGGYVGAYMDAYIEPLRQLVSEQDPYSDNALYLTPCAFKYEASAVGAAMRFIEGFIRKI